MDWSDARIRGFIIGVLRAGMRRWPPKYEVKNAAKTEKKVNPKSKRIAQFYQCAKCKGEYVSTEIEIDHKKPVVDPKEGFVDWNVFIDRLFIPAKGMQALCKTCHKDKSEKERIKRTK